MNKIRVIDLLNKIANGEGVPKVIVYGKCMFKYNESTSKYYLINGNRDLFDYISYGYNLNDEVEIIEESEQEIDIQAIEELEIGDVTTLDKLKINELVQAVKQLDRKI